MLDLRIDERGLEGAARRAGERGVVLPTLAQMREPGLVPGAIRARLGKVGLWDVNSLNLFRITWHNEPTAQGGGFGAVNTLEFPSALTGTEARIVALVGKWFPTGAHKVGATAGCLLPALVTGQFDPTRHKAVWPSTGNFCRGGAYNAALLGCESIAVLPQQMSRERFEWLAKLAGEVITTPGGESNVKEIFDKCKELRATRSEAVIFNQFEHWGNYLWHYQVTGPAMAEALQRVGRADDGFVGVALTTGSAGTLAAGDYLKGRFAGCKVAAGEARQCPTLLLGGFGDHRIEGIGDKHVPWIHNARNTDVVGAIDDAACMALVRLFNEPAGRAYLGGQGVAGEVVERLGLLGISGVANLLLAIKLAKWYELDGGAVVVTVLTDSMELYGSRVAELREREGAYTRVKAAADFHRYLLGCGTEGVAELSYPQRLRLHNLKYYTWVEQQGKSAAELRAQWYDAGYWGGIRGQAGQIDELIGEFNGRSGALKRL